MKEILSQGLQRGFLDGPPLFNLFINDPAFFIQQNALSNYADGNNLFVSGEDKELTNSLRCSDFKKVENWFPENYLVLNPEKRYFMCIAEGVTDSELLNFNDHFNFKKFQRRRNLSHWIET